MELKTCCGRGGWSWYTGSASWCYRCGMEYLLGLKIRKDRLEICPCIPEEWEKYSIQYKYGKSIYNIKINNQRKTNQVQTLIINGIKQERKDIPLRDENQIYEIEVIV